MWLAFPVIAVPLPHAWTAMLEPQADLPPLAWLASAPARARRRLQRAGQGRCRRTRCCWCTW
ncbi:hypothetical protein LP419_14560 [Massilia sp. H-1]|nr:hypothetical protein LP419_14560 [Massilia sp. H-1]